MSAWEKFRQKLLSGQSDQNIDFERLRTFLKRLDFDEDISGSHHIYGRPGVEDIIDIQPRHDGKAKSYQVKQIRKILEDNDL